MATEARQTQSNAGESQRSHGGAKQVLLRKIGLERTAITDVGFHFGYERYELLNVTA